LHLKSPVYFGYTPQSVHPSIPLIIILTCSVTLRQSVQWCLSSMVNILHASVRLQLAFYQTVILHSQTAI